MPIGSFANRGRRTPELRPPGSLGPVRSLLLGATIPAGWILHDLTVFLVAGEPGLVVCLIPGCAVALLVGALLGLISARFEVMVGMTIALGAWSVLPLFVDTHSSPTLRWLPRVATLHVVLIAMTRYARIHWGTGQLRVGLALGVFGSVSVATYRYGVSDLSWYVAGSAVASLLLEVVKRARWRRIATAACVAIPVYMVAGRVIADGDPLMWSVPRAHAARPRSSPPNLVLIVLDTVRADRLAPYGYERVTTPGLDRFVREHATLYTQARSTSSWTLPSHASMLTGLLPGMHGARNVDVPSERKGANALDDRFVTLAEVLQQESFQTAAIVANPWFLKPSLGLAQGFDRYDARPGGWIKGGYVALAQFAGTPLWVGHLPYRRGASVTKRALRWLDDMHQPDSPFFLMLNYMDAHYPHLPPPPFDRAFGDDVPIDPLRVTKRLLSAQYDRELLHLDANVTRFLRGLEERNLFEGTAIIITADHGEAFGEHGFWNHNKQSLHEEIVHVPLYMKPAEGRRESINEDLFNGAQIYELALQEVGLFEGAPSAFELVAEWHHRRNDERWESLLPELERKRDLLMWIEDGIKYVVSSSGSVQAYELALDPGELQPLLLSESSAERARHRAQEWWSSLPPIHSSGRETDEEADQETLQALGYAGE